MPRDLTQIPHASIIVPLYNEEFRAPPFLNELSKFAKQNWEIILVNDGSTDNTLEMLKKYNFPNKKIISYKVNRGKGYAVKSGVANANGDYIIFIDADGSIHPSQIEKLLLYLKKYDVVVGNRTSRNSDVYVPFYRHFVGRVFNNYAKFLFNIPIEDNLCGFKGFKKGIAKAMFKDLISERWIFDVELFYKIKKRKYSLYMMSIKWSHKNKSKMGFFDMVKMAFEMVSLRMMLRK